MIIGYARVSTSSQDHALQIDGLRDAGCERVVEETGSGSKDDRPQLKMLLDMMREGDILVVWKLDRLGRSMQHLVNTISELQKRGIEFRCVTQAIDTTTPGGKLTFGIFAAIAEFERSMIIERTKAGIEAALKRGVKLGHPRSLTDIQVAGAILTIQQTGRSISSLAKELGVHHKTMSREIKIMQAATMAGIA